MLRWTQGIRHSRLDGLAEVVENILGLARVRPDLVEDVPAGLVGLGRGSVGCGPAAEAVAGRTALGHGDERRTMERRAVRISCLAGRLSLLLPLLLLVLLL